MSNFRPTVIAATSPYEVKVDLVQQANSLNKLPAGDMIAVCKKKSLKLVFDHSP